MGLKDKVVVITGGSAGVGRATAEEFAKRGANLALISRDQERLDQAKAELEQLYNISVLALAADVADATALVVAAGQIEQVLGPIDIWVNNAMVTVFSPIKDATAEDFKRVTGVTYLGVVNGTLAALPYMLERDRGVIVQVGSALAYRGMPLQAPYSAAKHAVEGFHESLRSELLHDNSNVRVTMVQLPAINTPQFEWSKSRMLHRAQPLPPIFQPEVAAKAIVWAATHNRRQVLVGWPSVFSIWMNKLVPGLGDRYLARSAYKKQQTDEPEDPDRPNNLWKPVEGNSAAHGRFDGQAKEKSPQLWMTMNRNWLAAGILLTLLITVTKKRKAGHGRAGH